MPGSPPPPPKKEVALALLERSSDRGIYVHLDPRKAGVVVPPWLKKQPQLVLQIGLNMAIPIPDLRLDDEGLSCTLSFNRAPFFCAVPWTGVFAIVDDEAKGMIWPDDVPPEIARQTQVRAVETPPRKNEPAAIKGAKAKRPRKRPSLAAVPGEGPPPAVKPVAPLAPGPSASPGLPSSPAATASSEPESTPAPSAPSAPASQPAGTRAAKPKRELPPYLRVVK